MSVAFKNYPYIVLLARVKKYPKPVLTFPCLAGFSLLGYQENQTTIYCGLSIY